MQRETTGRDGWYQAVDPIVGIRVRVPFPLCVADAIVEVVSFSALVPYAAPHHHGGREAVLP